MRPVSQRRRRPMSMVLVLHGGEHAVEEDEPLVDGEAECPPRHEFAAVGSDAEELELVAAPHEFQVGERDADADLLS